ncbi:hypothetical protein ACO1O0_006924 [Amphichorda felina]
MATVNGTSSGPLGTTPMAQQPQFTMLDMMIPGFSTLCTVIHAYFGVDLNLYIPLLLLVCGTAWSWSYTYSYFRSIVEEYLMCSVRICTDDEIFNMVMGWVAQQGFSHQSRRFMANTNLNSRNWMLWRFFDDDDEDDECDDMDAEVSGTHKPKKLHCTPSRGSHFFWFRGHPLIFERRENENQLSTMSNNQREEIHIWCFGRNPEILKELLVEARQQHMAKDESRTLIYRGATGNGMDDPEWKRCMARSTRPFSTVILNDQVKKELIDDVSDYLNPATRRWYANRGIPYRRGYLLYGPPGTGKSSLSLALAGFFNMRIYILSLSSPMATEENVASLFSSLPRRCVVLLEDIDSAGLTHTRENGGANVETTVPSPPKTGNGKTPAGGPLSLSGLLNILDGVASQEGRVLIMTTNHLENLDKALIRPGRVDMTVEFGRADTDMTAAIFRAIYTPYDGERNPSTGVDRKGEKQSSPEDDHEGNRAKTLEQIDDLAQRFAAKIPGLEFSPAEIQGLLLRHKRDPLAVLDAAEGWIEQTRKEKAEKEVREAEERRKLEEERKKEEEKKKRKEEKRKAKKANKGKKKTEEKNEEEEEEEEEEEKDEGSGSGSDSESGEENESNEDGKKSDGKDGKKTPSDSGYGTP